MIDAGASLNICSLNLVKQLGYLEDTVDPAKRTTIRAYDAQERSFKWMVIFPISIDPVTKETIFQVLDVKVTYNTLLGRPLIHDM